MIKFANPDTMNMLKGLASSGAIGAGIGAAGMGLANIAGPDENEQGQKKRGLLKSMLLGGALGGATGAGGRAAWDLADPSMASDTGSGVNQLMHMADKSNTPPPTHNSVLSALSAFPPPLTGGAIGTGVGVGSGAYRRLFGGSKFKDVLDSTKSLAEKRVPGEEEKYLNLLKTRRDSLTGWKGFAKSPMGGGIGGLIGGTGMGMLARPLLDNQANYDQHNNPATLYQLFKEQIAQQQAQAGK